MITCQDRDSRLASAARLTRSVWIPSSSVQTGGRFPSTASRNMWAWLMNTTSRSSGVDGLVVPVAAGLDHPAPAVPMELASRGAAFADHGQGHLVGGLMLVEAVAGKHFAMPCQDVGGVFDRHAVEDLMGRVGHQAIDRPDEPLSGVEQMRQRVLNGSSATGSIGVVDCPISRAIGREMLAGNSQQLHGLAESARRDRPPHRGQERVAAIDIGDARDQIASREGPLQRTRPPRGRC